ncbi:ATP-binding protein [Streptomyces sp. NBC_01190]|uniref:ATP-binding protein n=1 Tax=Streptomyces sp. NBC_01190 TaxID=2903767 RepID=UPI00386AB2C2|nr:ATP-binding protein [Streptomyces sp. NBC_01190]
MSAQNVPPDEREPIHAPGLSFHSRLDLACDPSATRHAVAYASNVLRAWDVPRDVAADALLIVDELVTNAVRHAGASTEPFELEGDRLRAGNCGLGLWTCCGHLLIGVHDETDQVPILREVSLDAENGRGIQIVAGLCNGAWGYTVQPSQPGKLVWAQLPLPHHTPPSTRRRAGAVA